MSSFQEDFYLETANPLRRVWRNVRLLGYVLSVAWLWSVVGGRVRRGVRRARRSGKPYIIDPLGAGGGPAEDEP